MSRRLAAALAASLYIAAAAAAPRAESALECGIAADMAVVAHSLAREAIERPQANRIMARVYDVATSERAQQIMQEILDAAYSTASAAAGGTGQKFGEELFDSCIKSGGN